MRKATLFLTTAMAVGAAAIGGAVAADPNHAPASAPAAAVSQPVPEAMPYDIPYGAPITLGPARHALRTAEVEARKHGWKLDCAVVEPSGELVSFDKMDGAQYASIDIAIAKARAAARFRRSTKIWSDAVKSGNLAVLSLPGAIALEGGFPILRQGRVVGAIGCSGGLANQDATAARAGADTMK